jgi:hypothetical protein
MKVLTLPFGRDCPVLALLMSLLVVFHTEDPNVVILTNEIVHVG